MAEFERDIVLANDDGKVYHLTQDVLAKLEAVDLTDNRYQLIKGLLKQGVSSAAIPTEDDPGPEPQAFCFLLNLSSLNKAQSYE